MTKFEEEFDKFHRENHNMQKESGEQHDRVKRRFEEAK